MTRYFLFVLAALATAPAWGSTSSAWSSEQAEAMKACRTAANLHSPVSSAPILFSDELGVDAILVTGRWKPVHMKRAAVTLLCLYNRKLKTAEAQEAIGWTAAAAKPRPM